MKHVLIIFTLLSLNHAYSQRFITNQPFVNVSYNPRSLDEMMTGPLIQMKKADENFEKIRSLRKELSEIKNQIKLDTDYYYPVIDKIDNALYKLSLADDLALVGEYIIKIQSLIDTLVKNYNNEIDEYNYRKNNSYYK